MKKLLLIGALLSALSFAGAEGYGQTAPASSTAGATRAKQEQLIGEITSIDAATGQVTIKTDAGRSVSVNVNEATSYLRIAPGERTLDSAAKLARTDLQVGDRVLVRPAGVIAEGQPITARQLIVVNKQALTGREERNREDWRRRGLNGRVAALNPATREITIGVRSREGAQDVVISASNETKILRYAPDSVRREDAQPSSFGELKVGDQLRARGERSADGTRFQAEEIIAGSFTRATGTIAALDAAKNEVTIKDEQTGKTFTVVVGGRSMLRRVPTDFVEQMARHREERQAQRAAARENAGEGQPGNRREQRSGDRTSGERGQRQWRGGVGGGGGGNPQQMFEGMPAITVGELKKGDVVLITGTPATDSSSRLTIITLVTGDAALMKRLQQFQGQGGGQRNMNPGLPGDVIGGGTERERP